MSLGAGIFLFVVGAILAFAVQDSVDFINLVMVGYIMMGAGLLGVILGVTLMMKKRSSVSTVRTSDPVNGDTVTERENVIR